REHQYEWISMQRAAISNDRGSPPGLPACLRPNAELGGLYARLPVTQPSDAEIQAAAEPLKTELGKYRAASNTLTSGKIGRASLLYDRLSAQFRSGCTPQPPVTNPPSTYCMDLQNNIQRVQAAFPVLFGNPNPLMQGTMISVVSEADRAQVTSGINE